MTCKYNFKGKEFQSEEELNDYLLNTESSKISQEDDVVYQLTATQNHYRKEIFEKAQEEYKDLRKKGIQIKEYNEEVEPEDLDDVGNLEYPYISVTDLIHTMPGRYTEQVFPIFRSDEYWKEKFSQYKQGIFDKYEIQFIRDIIDPYKDASGNYTSISNEDVLNKIRDRIEGKLSNGIRKGGLWKQQAICGNLVHEMFSRFYRDTVGKQKADGTWIKGEYLYELKEYPDRILTYFKNNIRDEFKDYVSDDILKSIIKQCIQLDSEIREKYGKNAFIRTEQPIAGNLSLQTEGGKVTKVIGKIDLVVVGENGEVGIIDFKCSPKDYTTSNVENDPMYYNSAKILTFKYQLAVYRRILNELGVRPTSGIDLFVVPLKFEDFKMENGKVSFSGISSLGDLENNTMLQELSNSKLGNEYNNIEGNLSQVFPVDTAYVKTSLESTNIIKKTKDVMDVWCPVKQKDTTLDGYKQTIKEKGGIKFDSQTNKYYYKPNRYNDDGMIQVTASSQEEATIKIIEEMKKRDDYNQSFAINASSSMRKAFNNYYNGGEIPLEQIQTGYSSRTSASKRNSNYVKSQLEKYTNTDIWKPIPESESDPINMILDQFGLLLFENKNSHLIDVVRVSALYNPAQKVKLNKGEYILGSFLPDTISHNSADSLTMLSTKGNIELIESMVVLNQLNGTFKPNFSGIGKVKLLCPSQQTGLDVSNEQLLYNFDRLCQQKPDLIKNNFKTQSNSQGNIKMATYLDILKQDFLELLGKSDKYGLNSLDRDLKASVSKFDWKGKNQEEIKDFLMKLDKQLIEHYNDVTQNIKERLDDNNPQYKLHKDILYAIAELSGVKMVQQLEEQKKFDLSWEGLGGTMIDNPGTLQSTILNQATNQVTIAYQNTRDSVLKFDTELKNKIRKLKESKGFNWLSQNLTGNQTASLYKNMYDSKSSDIKFVNPWDNNVSLTNEEREFLKYAIIKINSTRGNGLNLEKLLANPDQMGELIAKDTEGKYLKAPLVKGDFASEVAMRGGILNFIRDRFKYFNVLWNKQTQQELKEKIDDTVTGLLDTSQNGGAYDLIKKGEQWEAINTMSDLDDPKNSERRMTKISKRGKAYFEHNLETLLLKQHSAYVMAEELNKVFPIIQSLLIHLNSQGAVLNTNFTNDIQYLLDYIKTKVHNQPMEDRTTQEAKLRDIVNETMKWASRLALAFNPRQTYQFLDGIWQDIKLFIKQPDGTMAFTKENLTWAWKFVMGDLFGDYGDNRSITELLNIKYGINDMDMNTYIDRIKSDNTGLFTHFWDTGFRFASRPDYYNRMTIFIAQMRADGSFEAHSVKDGKLIYDWTKDKRFEAFANKDKSDINKYNQAKSNYITLARQLVEEGAKNEDGTLFKFDIMHPERTPLPKAYSNKESEGRKAFSDRIYGYYAHEKKSMFNSTFVGALTMQMNTYWSAKKNQYIQKRSYTQEGYYVDYVEDGIQYFWKVDENTGELIPTTENTGVPIKVWKGRPQEGIVITVLNLGRAFKGSYEGLEESGLKGIKELLTNENIDPDLRRLYAANLKQLWYDLIMLLLLGVFASSLLHNGQKEFAKTHTNENFGNALANTAINLGVGIIDSSADDFNFGKSIFGRGVQWTPFAISSMTNVVNQYKNMINGSQDFYDAVIKTTSATRGTTPFWDFVKLNTIGTKVGEKPE